MKGRRIDILLRLLALEVHIGVDGIRDRVRETRVRETRVPGDPFARRAAVGQEGYPRTNRRDRRMTGKNDTTEMPRNNGGAISGAAATCREFWIDSAPSDNRRRFWKVLSAAP